MRRWQITTRALRLLLRYPLRSGLLILSAALGVLGVVCSVNYGSGGTRQVLDQIRRLGTNVLIVTPAQSRTIAGRARTGSAVTTLVERDYAELKRELPERTRSSALVNQSFWIKAGDLSKNAAIVGCEPDFFIIKDWPVTAGDVFDAAQARSAARVALLGHTVAIDLFGTSSPIGQRIMINRVPFIVAGVLAERGQGLDVSNEDNQIYMPLNTAMRRLMNVDYYSGIVIEIDALSHMDTAAWLAASILHQLHHIQPDRSDDFQVQNQKSLLDTQLEANARLAFFLRAIGASALAVSGLGIVAITWMAVKERTREFGTRRALGATAGDIFFQTLLEAVVLATIGVGSALAFSWPLSRQVNLYAGLPFVFERSTAILACIAALGLNLVFASLPARKAASISPIEALRYE